MCAAPASATLQRPCPRFLVLRHRNYLEFYQYGRTTAYRVPQPLRFLSSRAATPTSQQKTNLSGGGSFAGVGGERGLGRVVMSNRRLLSLWTRRVCGALSSPSSRYGCVLASRVGEGVAKGEWSAYFGGRGGGISSGGGSGGGDDGRGGVRADGESGRSGRWASSLIPHECCITLPGMMATFSLPTTLLFSSNPVVLRSRTQGAYRCHGESRVGQGRSDEGRAGGPP